MNSNDDIIKNNYAHIIESYLAKAEKSNYNLQFNVLYYNQNVRPWKWIHIKYFYMALKKIKFKKIRRYIWFSNYFIKLPAGDYSTEYSNAIAIIKCKIPDFVPNDIYTKLECDGLDINPQNGIYLHLDQDFNKSSTPNIIANSRNVIAYYDDEKKSLVII